MGQESRCHSSGCLWLKMCLRLQSGAGWGCRLIWKLSWGMTCFSTVRRLRFLPGCWPDTSLSHHMAFLRGSTWESKAQKPKTQAPNLVCNLTLEVTSHYSCYVPCIRSKSKGPAHSQPEEMTKGCDSQQTEATGAIAQAAYHLSCAPS